MGPPCGGLRVSDLMTGHPVTAAMNAPVHEVARLLAQHHVRHLPVVDSAGRVRGILSNRDMLHAHLHAAPSSHERVASALMSQPVLSVRADTCVRAAARLMFTRKVGCLPVLDDAGRPLGILTESDFVRAYFERPASPCRCALQP